MVTVERARPGAKAFARLFGREAVRALEALTGRAPTPPQLALLGEATSKCAAGRYRCPMRPTPAPRAHALSFHRAGRAVADAALVPRRTARFPDPCDTFEAMESPHDKLTRRASIMLSGCAAESYATGSTAHHQPAVSIITFSAFVLGDGCVDDLNRAVIGFEDCTSSALRHAWPVVEAVEARLYAGRSADDVLVHLPRAPANEAAHPPTRAALDCHLRSVGDRVTALALALHRAGGCAR